MVFGIKWIGVGEWRMEAMLRVLSVLLGGVRERAKDAPGRLCWALVGIKKGSAGRFRSLDPIS